MNADFVGYRRAGSAIALSLLAFSLVGCATVRNPSLERAREACNWAWEKPDVAARAAVALDQALLTLEQAEQIWTRELNAAEVDHLAYLTEKRAEIARFTARRWLAADEIQQIRSRRE